MRTLLAVTFALFVPACLDADDDSLTDTEQVVSGTNLYGLQTCTTTDPSKICSYDLGAVSGRSCVLAGVGGQLGTGGSSEVWIGTSGSHFWLYIRASANSVKGQAVCTTPYTAVTIANRYWYSGHAATYLGNTAGMMCSLAGVHSAGGFRSSGDDVEIYKSGNNWYVGGSQAGGTVQADATCVVPTYVVGTYGATSTRLLAHNVGDTACALNSTGGIFTTASDATWIEYDSVNKYWNAIIRGTHAMEATCFN